MLTGIEPPTSGSTSVLGYDTWTQWVHVQKFIGLCPQQSILYDMLTPREHLTMYGKLKGVLDNEELKKDVKRYNVIFIIRKYIHKLISFSQVPGFARLLVISVWAPPHGAMGSPWGPH